MDDIPSETCFVFIKKKHEKKKKKKKNYKSIVWFINYREGNGTYLRIILLFLFSFNRNESKLWNFPEETTGDPVIHQRCSPVTNVLFLKTHKTGSSTVSNIFFRYGDSRDLSFILGGDTLIGWPGRFRIEHTLKRNNLQPNFLCSHTRYSKKTMNYLFPKNGSKYITILRNPVEQFESVFSYMGLGKVYNLGADPTQSIKLFLRKGIEFKDIHKTRSSVLARNPMMFDLGLDPQFYQNATAVKNYIAFLEKEFDLVMLMEYFEESVVLMKRLLCWELSDVLHIKTNERIDKEKVAFSENMRENIKRWNKADMLLYDHFNKTFWNRIQLEGEGFYKDLAVFQQMKNEMEKTCYSGTTLQMAYSGKYVKSLALNPNLSQANREKCEKMTRKENSYLEYLRRKQSFKSSGPMKAVLREENEPNKLTWDAAKDLRYDPLPL